MTQQNPQVFEPHLDQILAGTMTEPSALQSILRNLLVCRRRYNDPHRVAGERLVSRLAGDYAITAAYEGGYQSDTGPDQLGGVPFSNLWTIASQKTRVEAGIAFLMPIVGAAVGSYPPFPALFNGGQQDGAKTRIDSMGNQVPSGMP